MKDQTDAAISDLEKIRELICHKDRSVRQQGLALFGALEVDKQDVLDGFELTDDGILQGPLPWSDAVAQLYFEQEERRSIKNLVIPGLLIPGRFDEIGAVPDEGFFSDFGWLSFLELDSESKISFVGDFPEATLDLGCLRVFDDDDSLGSNFAVLQFGFGRLGTVVGRFCDESYGPNTLRVRAFEFGKFPPISAFGCIENLFLRDSQCLSSPHAFDLTGLPYSAAGELSALYLENVVVVGTQELKTMYLDEVEVDADILEQIVSIEPRIGGSVTGRPYPKMGTFSVRGCYSFFEVADLLKKIKPAYVDVYGPAGVDVECPATFLAAIPGASEWGEQGESPYTIVRFLNISPPAWFGDVTRNPAYPGLVFCG